MSRCAEVPRRLGFSSPCAPAVKDAPCFTRRRAGVLGETDGSVRIARTDRPFGPGGGGWLAGRVPILQFEAAAQGAARLPGPGRRTAGRGVAHQRVDQTAADSREPGGARGGDSPSRPGGKRITSRGNGTRKRPTSSADRVGHQVTRVTSAARRGGRKRIRPVGGRPDSGSTDVGRGGSVRVSARIGPANEIGSVMVRPGWVLSAASESRFALAPHPPSQSQSVLEVDTTPSNFPNNCRGATNRPATSTCQSPAAAWKVPVLADGRHKHTAVGRRTLSASDSS